ncbi:MAG: AAA family ATPase [Fimbriimonadales bacterium]|nr:MAG: ATPase [Fimbriimonadales bacterium]
MKHTKPVAAERGVHKAPPRLTALKIRNYRVLRDVEFRDLTPLTVLIGPNGSGKSTVFDVFAFLSECFESGLRRALDRRGRLRELRSRDSHGPIVIEIKYKETPRTPTITYHLAIDERDGAPIVAEEWLQWRRSKRGKPFRFLEYREGKGRAISGEAPDEHDQRIEIPLKSADLLAVNALGQFEEHPRVAALRDFITGWYVSYFSADNARGQPEAGPQERLSRTGDNLPNVLQYLSEQHPDRLEQIFNALRRRVPRIEKVIPEIMPDGRLLLMFKDKPFSQPILARFASDGTIKLLAYLILFYDPTPPPFIGIEEPENFLYPRLLYELGEECRIASERTQILVTTHSPDFLNAMRPKEVWILSRGTDGYTTVLRASEDEEVRIHYGKDAQLGYLWARNFLDIPAWDR